MLSIPVLSSIRTKWNGEEEKETKNEVPKTETTPLKRVQSLKVLEIEELKTPKMKEIFSPQRLDFSKTLTSPNTPKLTPTRSSLQISDMESNDQFITVFNTSKEEFRIKNSLARTTKDKLNQYETKLRQFIRKLCKYLLNQQIESKMRRI
jgi:hypothetical protein